jgi:hypothetical protein
MKIRGVSSAPNGIRIHVRIRKAGLESQHGIQNVIEELCNLGIVDFVAESSSALFIPP